MICCAPKFLVDASLAGLAKWLRLFGFDTLVNQQQVGRPMMRQAQADDRIILTRRRDMMERQFSGRIVLLPEMETALQLAIIIDQLSLEIYQNRMFTLCLTCNEKLMPVTREDVRDLVPEYVFEHCHEYNQCPVCRKIFWKGTHCRNAMNYLKRHNVKISFSE